ncbi:MAG: hypothetical protein ACPHRO_14315, partial [Nannocystaceae bacterium]
MGALAEERGAPVHAGLRDNTDPAGLCGSDVAKLAPLHDPIATLGCVAVVVPGGAVLVTVVRGGIVGSIG